MVGVVEMMMMMVSREFRCFPIMLMVFVAGVFDDLFAYFMAFGFDFLRLGYSAMLFEVYIH